MGAGRYDTNKRVNTAAAAAAAARANPIVSDPVVNLPVKSVVQPAPEEFASLASPFDAGFSNSNFGGYEGLDLNLSGLDTDALREAVNPTPVPVERVPTTASTSGLSVQDFGAQPKFESPDEALVNYGNVFNTLKGQEEQVNKVYNYNNFDPGDFGRSSVTLREGNRAAGTGLAEYVQQNDIPLSKVIDGERKYLTTGNRQANLELWPNAFQGGDLVATGPVGTYSTTFQKDDNLFTQVLNDPIIGLAANFIPGGTLAMTAAKAAAGVKLSPIEIANGLMTGLKMSNVITAPAETALAAGQVGPNVVDTGTGLFGTTYAQTQTALNVAAAGDLEGGAVTLVLGSEFGKNAVTDGLAKIGLDEKTLTDAGIQLDDFRAGVDRAIREAAGGADIDEALLSGFSKYVREGGTLDIPLGGLEDVIRDIVRPIGEVGTALGQFVKDAVPDINSNVDTSGITDALKAVGAFVEEEVTQPVGGALSTADTAVRQGLSALDEEVLQPITQPINDALSALDTAVRQALPDINGPDIDLPSFDLNIPNFNPAFGTTQLNYSAPSSTRTTDSLFKDELFQFQTEIGVDLEPTEYVDLGFSDPFQDQTLLQRYPF
tara:strand:+ start:336 stop:2144 length:1809 start_codon:yes stop_codon:yes gene_type:complete